MQEFHVLLREWESFYLLTGTAGATLAGLMFVAVTLGQQISDRRRFRRTLPILRAHSDPALLAFVLSLVLGTMMLMPTLSRFWFGSVLLAAGLLSLLYIGIVLRQLIKGGVAHTWDASDWLWYAGAPVLGGVLLLASGGLGFSAHSRAALTLIGVTSVVLLIMGIRNAWDLVTFTLAHGQDDEPGGEPENARQSDEQTR